MIVSIVRDLDGEMRQRWQMMKESGPVRQHSVCLIGVDVTQGCRSEALQALHLDHCVSHPIDLLRRAVPPRRTRLVQVKACQRRQLAEPLQRIRIFEACQLKIDISETTVLLAQLRRRGICCCILFVDVRKDRRHQGHLQLEILSTREIDAVQLLQDVDIHQLIDFDGRRFLSSPGYRSMSS